jgi:hypothetical protein
MVSQPSGCSGKPAGSAGGTLHAAYAKQDVETLSWARSTDRCNTFRELVGKAAILSDGRAGTVETVSLNEDHGLRISIRGHPGIWPVPTIKFAQK